MPGLKPRLRLAGCGAIQRGPSNGAIKQRVCFWRSVGGWPRMGGPEGWSDSESHLGAMSGGEEVCPG